MSQRMRGDERRAQLIDVALACFAEHGYDGTSTRAIAAAAGVTEGLIFRHFPTKRDLLRAVIERHSPPPPDPEQEQRIEEMPIQQALERILSCVAERLWRNRQFVRMVLTESFHQGEAFEELVTLLEQAPRRVGRLIRARIAAGEIHAADPEAAARMLGGALFALFQSQQHRGESEWRERSADFIRETVRIFLWGSATKGSDQRRLIADR
jgi:AcrR family transcriptional regulator